MGSSKHASSSHIYQKANRNGSGDGCAGGSIQRREAARYPHRDDLRRMADERLGLGMPCDVSRHSQQQESFLGFADQPRSLPQLDRRSGGLAIVLASQTP